MYSSENDILDKVRQLCNDKNWTMYRLAKESDIAYSNLNNMMNRNTQPSIPTLKKICNGLGLTLSEFFDDTKDISTSGHRIELNAKETQIIEYYRNLSDNDKELLRTYLAGLCKKKVF
ncbi:MAG: helix-turn-helix domain-containing protein [Lachnospiraceae bacterium]